MELDTIFNQDWEIDPGYFQICCDRLDEVEG